MPDGNRPTKQELATALKNAHLQGDVWAARKLADAYYRRFIKPEQTQSPGFLEQAANVADTAADAFVDFVSDPFDQDDETITPRETIYDEQPGRSTALPPEPKPQVTNISPTEQSNIDTGFGSQGRVAFRQPIVIKEGDGARIIPTRINGEIVSPQQAYRHFLRTGKSFGRFESVEQAQAWYDQHVRAGILEEGQQNKQQPGFRAAPDTSLGEFRRGIAALFGDREFRTDIIDRIEDAGSLFFDAIVPDAIQSGMIGTRKVIATGAYLAGLNPETVYDTNKTEFAIELAQLAREQATFGPSDANREALQNFLQAEGVEGMLQSFQEAPVATLEALGNVVMQSLATYAPVVAAEGVAGAVAGPAGIAVTTGAGSFVTDFTLNLLGHIRAQGGDPTDPMAWLSALRDEEFMAQAREEALKHAGSVALFDALTAGLAGQLMRLARNSGRLATVTAATGEATTQAVGGAAGEATGQLLAQGEVRNPAGVVIEALAEIPTAIPEAAGNIANTNQPGSEAGSEPSMGDLVRRKAQERGINLTFGPDTGGQQGTMQQPEPVDVTPPGMTRAEPVAPEPAEPVQPEQAEAVSPPPAEDVPPQETVQAEPVEKTEDEIRGTQSQGGGEQGETREQAIQRIRKTAQRWAAIADKIGAVGLSTNAKFLARDPVGPEQSIQEAEDTLGTIINRIRRAQQQAEKGEYPTGAGVEAGKPGIREQTSKNVIETFRNEEEGTEAGVVELDDGRYSAVLMDLDTGKIVGGAVIFPSDQRDAAIAKARELANLPEDTNAETQGEQEGQQEETTTETSEEEFEANGRRVYPVTIRGEQKWAIETPENRAKREAGERTIGGDTVVDTREEAIERAAEEVQQAEQRRQRVEQAEQEQQQAREAELADDLNGFIEDMSAMRAGQVRKALSRPTSDDEANVTTRRELIEDRAEAGTLKTRVTDNGTYVTAGRAMGKIAYEYANYLLDRPSERDAGSVPDTGGAGRSGQQRGGARDTERGAPAAAGRGGDNAAGADTGNATPAPVGDRGPDTALKPIPEPEWWRRLTGAERYNRMQASGVSGTARTSWNQLSPEEQHKLNAQWGTEADNGEPEQLEGTGANVPEERVPGVAPEAGQPGDTGQTPADDGEQNVPGGAESGIQRGGAESGVPDGERPVSVPAAGGTGGRRGSQRSGSTAQGDGRNESGAAENDGRAPERRPDGDNAGLREKQKQAAEDEPASTGVHTNEGQPVGKRPASMFTITEDTVLAEGGPKTKFKNNLKAIKTLKEIEAEGRQATPEEQAILVKYVGWGGLAQAFPRPDGSVANGWEKEAEQLQEVLTETEYEAARSSTQNAHFTTPEVIRGIWHAIQEMGFDGGRVLEPSAGTGHFLGMMPTESRSSSQITASELDTITGGIAKLLYPGANIQAPLGFQNLTVPDGYFDVAVGNPPFGQEKVYDGKRKAISNFSIHNYFFAKSVDGLRDDGVLGMVVSSRLLDTSSNFKAREYIGDRADFLGAIRLPNTAFKENAGTEVTTDIIFLQKRPEGRAVAGANWQTVGTVTDDQGREVPLNQYFIDHPEMMLGKWGAYGSMYGPNEPALIEREGQDTAQLLQEAIAQLPKNIVDSRVLEPKQEQIELATSVENVKVGSMFVDDGRVLIREEDQLGETRTSEAEFKSARARERAIGMIRVRDAFDNLRKAQLAEDVKPEALQALRDKLNAEYDAFVKRNGYINQNANARVFRDDPSFPQLAALEENYDKGITPAVAKRTGEQPRKPSADKAAVFFRRTQRPYSPPTEAETAQDALTASLAEHGKVDMSYMRQLYGKSEADIARELEGLIFESEPGAYVSREEYLSGNVKKKLAEAKRMAEDDNRFRKNVEALEAVQPEDIEAVDIYIKPGATWLPRDVMEAFVAHIMGHENARVSYNPVTAKWDIRGKATAANQSKWSTDRANAGQILTAASAQRTMTIRDRVDEETTVVNQAATTAANNKIDDVKREFQSWVWRDGDRRERLHRLYNDWFNTNVQRRYDGSHLQFAGKVGDDIIKLRPHQKDAVWRIMQSRTTLLDHVVGSGKSFTAIAAAMEMRRTGRARKPMFVVPNHLIESGQWSREFQTLYPGANVLTATTKDFAPANRKKLFARVATGDWDAVIVPQSSFKKIKMDQRFQASFLKQEIRDMEKAIEEIREAEGKKSKSVKQAEKQRDAKYAKLQALYDNEDADDNLTFGELGVDALFVDESQCFPYETKVITDRGRIPIGRIVENRLPVNVLSLDVNTGRMHWCPVRNFWRHQRRNNYVTINTESGKLTCTRNHHIYVQGRGYVRADSIAEGETMLALRGRVYATAGRTREAPEALQPTMCESGHQEDDNEALRGVREGIFVPDDGAEEQRQETVLRQPVRSEVAHETAGPGAQSQRRESNAGDVGKPGNTITHLREAVGAYDARQSDAQPGVEAQDAPVNEGAPDTELWRERKPHGAATNASGQNKHGGGASRQNGTDEGSIRENTECLQGGFGRPGTEDSCRSGRQLPQDTGAKGVGSQEGCSPESARVVCVEVHQRGSESRPGRGSEQDQFVYDIGVEGLHNYFADGFLVHNSFKNLEFTTSMQNVAGLGDPSGSKKASDLFMKIRYIQQRTGGNTVFLTGTPISNSMVEMHTLMRYLDHDSLTEQGMSHLDAWARQFGDVVTDWELSPTGKYKLKSRFSKFVNMPELMQRYLSFADVVTNRDVKRMLAEQGEELPLPPIKGGKPQNVVVPRSEDQAQYIGVPNENGEYPQGSLVWRAEHIPRRPEKGDDNMLNIMSDAAKAALDMRILNTAYEDFSESKTNEAADRIKALYDQYDEQKGTQLVFIDLSTPKTVKEQEAARLRELSARADEGDETAQAELDNLTPDQLAVLTTTDFSVYDDLKDKLVAKGIEPDEVAFIQLANTKQKLADLYGRVRSGKVRVLLGSTQKMGAGMNVQDRLVALHHLDAPWRPSDLEQREGRIVRQGNIFVDRLLSDGSYNPNYIPDFEVVINRYATEQTLDSRRWQIIESKARFIEQIKKGDASVRQIEDITGESTNAAEMKAASSGNPLILEEMDLRKKIRDLELRESEHKREQFRIQDAIRTLESRDEMIDDRLLKVTSDAKHDIPDKFRVTIDGTTYDVTKANGQFKAAGKAVAAIMEQMANNGEESRVIGEYAGFDVRLDNISGKDFAMVLAGQYEYATTVNVESDPASMMQSLQRVAKGIDEEAKRLAQERKDIKEQLPQLQKQVGEFQKADELEKLRRRHQLVIDELKPDEDKPDNNATEAMMAAEGADTPMPSWQPTYSLTGTPKRPDNDQFKLGGRTIKLKAEGNPTRREGIRVMIEDIVGPRLYQGKIKGQSKLGFYREINSEIRTKDYNDVEVMTHEMAHYLDKHYQYNKRFTKAYRDKRYRDEVADVSYTSDPKKKYSEGFAEFVRLWLTNYEQAKVAAPKFNDKFEQVLAQDKRLDRKMHNLQREMHRWFYQGPRAQLRAKSGKELTQPQQIRKYIRDQPLERFRQNAVDNIHAAKVVERTLEESQGLGDASISPYKQFQLVNGAESVHEATMRFGTPQVNEDGSFSYSGKSLNEILKPAAKHGWDRLDAFMEYAKARRADELRRQGRERLFTKQEIEDGLHRGVEHPEFVTMFEEFQAFNERMLDFYEDMGLVTPEEKQAFRENNRNYVPFFRVVESLESGDSSRGYTIGKRLHGGSHNTREILDNIVDGLSANIRAAMYARARQTLYRRIQNNQNGSLFAVKIAPDSKQVQVKLDQMANNVAAAMAEAGLTVTKDGMVVAGDNLDYSTDVEDIAEALRNNPDLLKFWSFGHTPNTLETYVDSAVINGKRQYFEVRSPLLAEMMTGLVRAEPGGIFNVAFLVRGIMTRFITAMPQFLIPNSVRDTVEATVKSRNTFIPIWSTLRGMGHMLVQSDLYKYWMLHGGAYGTKVEEATSGGRSRSQIDLPVENGWDIVAKFLSGWDRFDSLFEYSSRIGDYELSIKKRGAQQAAFEAREITTDFKKRPRSEAWDVYMRMVPFMNAALQSLDNTARRIFEIDGKMTPQNLVKLDRDKARFMAAGSVITAMSILNWLLNKDDERYKRLTADQKGRYWWIWVPGMDNPITIPKAHDVATIFATIPTLALDYIAGQEGEAVAENLAWAVLYSLNIFDLPAIFQPTWAVQTNEKFTGAPVVPVYMQDLPAQYQYYARTPQIYRELGKALNVSPLVARQYASDWFGYVEATIAEMSEAILWQEDKWGPRPFPHTVADMFLHQFRGHEVPYRTKWTQGYFELRQRARAAKQAFEKLKAQAARRPEEFKNFAKNEINQALLAINRLFEQVDDVMTNENGKDLRDMVTAIRYNPDLTRKQKEAKINAIYKHINQLLKDVYKRAEAALDKVESRLAEVEQ